MSSYWEKILNLEKITIEHLIDLKGIIAVIRDSSDIPDETPFLIAYHDKHDNKNILNSNTDFFRAILDCMIRDDIENDDDMFILISIIIDGRESNKFIINFLNKLSTKTI